MKFMVLTVLLTCLAPSAFAERLICVEEGPRMRRVELIYPDGMEEGDVKPCELLIKDLNGKLLLNQPSTCTEEEDVYFTVKSQKNGNYVNWQIYQDELYSSTLNFEVQGLADRMNLNCESAQ